MGAIADVIRRLHSEGTSIEAIIAVVEAMEKPKRAPKDATAARATRLPTDWQLPRSLGMWALEEWPGLSPDFVRREAEAFRDYWCSRPTDATKLDWSATFKNWMRKAVGDRTGTNRPMTYSKPQSAVERRRDALQERIENGRAGRTLGSDRGAGAEAHGRLPLFSD